MLETGERRVSTLREYQRNRIQRRIMRTDQNHHQRWLAAGGMFLLSLLVLLADRAGVLTSFRPALHDAMSPGRLMILAITSRDGQVAAEATAGAVATELAGRAKQEQLLRQLMIENARLRRDLKRERLSTAFSSTLEPLGSLAQLDVIQASVVSSDGLSGSLRDLIIDAGKSAGITRSELVIDGTGTLLGAGSDDSVAAGDRVITGSIVVGRIERTARWVSLVQPVTAIGFKAQVVLLRKTADGLHFGATGMLEGTGEADCVLTGIPHTDAVAVGDDVVSADINGVRGLQLYFGRVTKAEFLAGGQWDVRVQPAASLGELESVGVLRLKLSPRP